MAAHSHGMAGSGEATASWPYRLTLRASVASTAPSARERRDGKDARIAGRVERHLRRGQPWRRWKKTAIPPLPKLKWTDGGVEEIEEITARLPTDWATRFRSGERARRRRRSVGNGGAAALLLRSYRRAEEMEMGLVSWWTGALGELKSWLAMPGHPRCMAA